MDERMNRQFIFLSNGMECNGKQWNRTGQDRTGEDSS
jgi:hypothetical protein